MLLTFCVGNYRTFRDETTLDLARDALTTLSPRHGCSWPEMVWRVAAVYGANASGKSTLLEAINGLHLAVRGHRDILHRPYALDDRHRLEPTSYAVDFVHEGERYRYSVEAHSWGIGREELWQAGARWRKLFVRTQEDEGQDLALEPGSSLRGATTEVRRITTARDLFLAMALRYEHATLASVARGLQGIRMIHHDDDERLARLQWLMGRLADGPARWSELCDAIAVTADLGVMRVGLEERDVPDEVLEEVQRLLTGDEAEEGIPETILQQLQRSLVFFHAGADGKERRLPVGAQSQGTLTWLATMGPAVDALRLGQTLLVDELDASLHPALVAELVSMFKDPEVNRTGAQLVFTTHDASLLDNSPTQLLEAGEVWFCEKSDDGAGELFGLADFSSPRKGTNKQRRYLAGAFGAIPRVDTSGIRHLLSAAGSEG